MRTGSIQLGDLLFGQTRGRILGLLFGHPDQTFFVRQIARETGISPGSVQRELELLSQVDIITRSKSGHQVYFQAKQNHPVFPELRSLITKTVGVFELLRSALAPFAGRISLAFVYGSIARREETAESDVDLMIVGEVTLDEILSRLAPVEHQIGRTINPTIYSSKEFESKLQSGNHFLRSVMRGEKVFVIGAEDDSRKVG